MHSGKPLLRPAKFSTINVNCSFSALATNGGCYSVSAVHISMRNGKLHLSGCFKLGLLEDERLKKPVGYSRVIGAGRRSRTWSHLKFLWPSCAQCRIAMMRAESVFQGPDDSNFNAVFAAHDPFRHIAFPGWCINIARRPAINCHLRHTPIPIRQRHGKPSSLAVDYKEFAVRNATTVKRMPLRVPTFPSFGRSLGTQL